MKPQGKVTIFMIVMIVMLSIYYFTLPDNKGNQDATTTNQTPTNNKSEEFEQLRADWQETRQTMITTLQGVLSSTNVSVEDKNIAIEAIQKLQTLQANEAMLETKIINMGFDDAFVKATETEVNVSVYVDSLTLEEVNEIILEAKATFGATKQVIVQFTIDDLN